MYYTGKNGKTFFYAIWNQEIPGAAIVLQTFELGNYRAQHHCIRTSPIGPINKSESRDSLFSNTQAEHRLMF